MDKQTDYAALQSAWYAALSVPSRSAPETVTITQERLAEAMRAIRHVVAGVEVVTSDHISPESYAHLLWDELRKG